MASRGQEQFYFVVTSDASLSIYPDNKSSSFKVFLKQPIEIGDDEWEVALADINYPYSWPNIGPAVNSYLAYYLDFNVGPVKLDFPNWQCESFDDIIKFLNKEVKQDGLEYKIRFGRDPLGRFRVNCLPEAPYYDLGFTPNMMKILGLNSHPDASNMSIDSFNEREKHRAFLRTYMKEDAPVITAKIKEKIRKCDNLLDFVKIIKDLIDWELLRISFDGVIPNRITDHSWRGTSKGIEKEIADLSGMIWEEIGPYWGITGVNLEDIMYNWKTLLEYKAIDTHLKASTPGILDPIQRMYIYTNIIQPIDMNDAGVRLLKLVNTRGEPYKTTQQEFNHLTYLPVVKGKISMFDILITDEFTTPVPFQNGTVVLTLHFRKILKQR